MIYGFLFVVTTFPCVYKTKPLPLKKNKLKIKNNIKEKEGDRHYEQVNWIRNDFLRNVELCKMQSYLLFLP